MKPPLRPAVWILLVVLASGVSPGADSADLNATLKKLSKATEDIHGVVAKIEYAETVGKRSIDGSGTLYVDFAGFVRAEVGGDTPRTMVFSPPYLYVHRVNDEVVDIYNVATNPDMLGQYLLLGFVPAGSAMKKKFKVEMVPDSALDGKPALQFVILPKKKDAARSIARIQLWVDPDTGLPLKHEIYHAGGESRLSVRYVEMSRDPDLPFSLFQPRWPEGTKVVRY